MNLEELYIAYAGTGNQKKRADGLLAQTHWLSSLIDFDPKTGIPMPTCFTEVLRRSCCVSDDIFPKDRAWKIINHSRASVLRLLGTLTEEPRRENEYMPIRSIRELDTASFVALSRRPGRNIREKLSDKPYMQAVKHYQSNDTTENRLLKAYVKKVVGILNLRHEYLGESDSLLSSLQRWLRSDEAQSISRWDNLPPNNTLISHRDYRRVWDSWRWLQTLDEDVDRDNRNFSSRAELKNHWMQLASAYEAGETQFAEMPVFVDWDKFSIMPWENSPIRRQKRCRRLVRTMPVARDAVCIDFALINPAYSSGAQSGLLDDSFIWQLWSDDNQNTADIALFESDALMLHDDAKTVLLPDLLFSKKIGKVELNSAAVSFSERLSCLFETDTLVWLTPDCVNEFDLEIIRRNINAYFSNAEPLPVSVAAVLECVDYSEIDKDGFSVVVFESVNEVTCATVMSARYDKELAVRVPETRGYIWERGIPHIVKKEVCPDNVGNSIALVDREGEWFNKFNPYGARHKNSSNIIGVDNSGEFDRFVSLNSRPVRGGSKLIALRKISGDLPIWRNKIPELMTKVLNVATAQMEYFYFVGKNTTIEPVRGKARDIPVDGQFVIPAGKKYFNLFQGTDEQSGIDGEAIEYAAFLHSPDMPFDEDVPCRLRMTYTYGVDDPYSLTFLPVNQALSPVHVEWRPKSEVPPEDVPGPSFEPTLTWKLLQNQVNPKTGDPSDFLKWAIEQGTYVFADTDLCQISSTFSSDWYEDRRGMRHSSMEVQGLDVKLHQYDFVYKNECPDVSYGDELYFYIHKQGNGYKGICIANNAFKAKTGLAIKIHNSLYVPFIRIWAEGRSINDLDCPSSFREDVKRISDILIHAESDRRFESEIRNEALFLLSCMGADMPDKAVEALRRKTNLPKSDLQARTLGFSLGDMSKNWQRNLFDWLLKFDDECVLRVLANAAWRNPGFIPSLSMDDVKAICPALMNHLNVAQTKIANASKGAQIEQNLYMYATRYLELVLALLRTRNSDNEELRQYLQPREKRAKTLTNHVTRLSRSQAFCSVAEKSRIELELPERLEDERHLPPLLYALKLYLTGDDRFNAIKVTGINEE